MSEYYPVLVKAKNREEIEKVSLEFLTKEYLAFQKSSWQLLDQIASELKIGMTEKDCRNLAMEVAKTFDVQKHWHKPYIRFGVGTTLTFHDDDLSNLKLQNNDLIYLDLGPVWPSQSSNLEYEGDVGKTFIFQKRESSTDLKGSADKGDPVNRLNPVEEAQVPDGNDQSPQAPDFLEKQKIAEASREIFREAAEAFHTDQLNGERIYKLAKDSAERKGYKLTENVKGHRLGDFPHMKYSKEKLADQIFVPIKNLWVLEIHIKHPQQAYGSFFEDIL